MISTVEGGISAPREKGGSHMSQRLVLIADDNEDVRNISKTILESRGFAVVQAADGEEAVEVAQRHRPDFIFLDLMMPVLDGWEAMALLKSDPEANGIPVVAISASEPPLEDIREAGFCAVITKPVSPPEMVEAVDVCLEAYERGDRWIPDLARRIAGD